MRPVEIREFSYTHSFSTGRRGNFKNPPTLTLMIYYDFSCAFIMRGVYPSEHTGEIDVIYAIYVIYVQMFMLGKMRLVSLLPSVNWVI